MDLRSPRSIHQRRQGSDHLLPFSQLNGSATARSGSIVPEPTNQFGRGLFADHPHDHLPVFPHSPFPYHYPSYYHHPPQDCCSRILREMVKEQIREEIMASEVERRRALEAEVRYELMLEQQNNTGLLPLRSSSLRLNFLSPSRLPHAMSATSERTHVEEKTVMSRDLSKSQREDDVLQRVEKDLRISEEVIKPTLPFLLPKPADESQAGLKRKAPETLNGANASSGCSKIKAKEAWSCALCLFSGTSKQCLEEHLSGEQHKANEEALRSAEMARKNHSSELPGKKEPTKEPIRAVPATRALPLAENETKEASQLESLQKSGEAKKEHEDVIANEKGYKFWCEVCGVGTFAEKVMDTHKAGRKHRRQVRNRGRTTRSSANDSQEFVAAEDGNESIAVDVIREEGDEKSKNDGSTTAVEGEKARSEGGEVRAMGSELVDMIKEEDWWAFMAVAGDENGLIDG